MSNELNKVSSRSMIKSINDLFTSPENIQASMCEFIEEATNGEVVLVDPTGPVQLVLESTAVAIASGIQKTEEMMRKMYPASATEQDHLYRHMTYKDYLNRFAVPSETKLTLNFELEELKRLMVDDLELGIKRLVIPRNTEFTVANCVFSIQYPIDIRLLKHGGLQLLWNTEITNDIQELNTNIIDYDIVSDGKAEWFRFTIPVKQLSTNSFNKQITAAMAVDYEVTLDDKFYFAKVYYQRNDGVLQEIKTTHSAYVYNPTEPTAVLTINNNKLKIYIPIIYQSNGLFGNAIKVDVYTTKGSYTLDLASYTPEDFEVNWKTLLGNRDPLNKYSEPLRTMRSFFVFSDQLTHGGRDQLTFEQLRNNVIKHTIGNQVIPVSNDEIKARLDYKGYNLIKNIDHVTNRQYLATKQLPLPTHPRLITSANVSMESIIFDMDSLKNISTVKHNGLRATVMSNTIYKMVNGKLDFVTDDELQSITKSNIDTIAYTVTKGNYYYSPFSYVVDTTRDRLEVRSYHIDKPKIEFKTFKGYNYTSLLEATIDSYRILKNETGYLLQVIVSGDRQFLAMDHRDVGVQISYIGEYSKERAFINGKYERTLDDGRMQFRFDIGSKFDIDNNDQLLLNGFSMWSGDARSIETSLLQDMDIVIYTIIKPSGFIESDIDLITANFLTNAPIYAITHESIRINFGSKMDNLYNRARTIISEDDYLKYEEDVYETYENDVYERMEDGGMLKIVNGKLVLNKIHSQGDFVLDPLTNEKILRHHAGDIVLDDNQRPIYKDPNKLHRQMDVLLIDGVYAFSNDAACVEYRDEMVRLFDIWINDELKNVNDFLLEKTKIFYYPKTTLGNIKVVIMDGIESTIPAAQSFDISLLVSDQVYNNADLRKQLRDVTIRTVSNALDNVVISMAAITDELRSVYGNDVIDVRITGLGGSLDLQALSIVDEVNRCSIKKRLTVQSDGVLFVEEDINVNFVNHHVKQR